MSRNIVRVNKTNNYTVMSNHHLRNEKLSWKAKGIHSYILSLPDDWKIIIEHLKTISKDGRDSTRSGIQELYDLRYWQRYPIHVDGKIDRWVTEIYEEPFDIDSKIKNIVIKNGIKTINYDNGTVDNFIEENNDLLTGKPLVVENTSGELLTGNQHIDNQHIDNPELLSTNNTKDLLSTNHSFNQSVKDEEKEIEGLNEIIEKAEVDIFEERKAIRQAIRILYYADEPIQINNMKIPPYQIREDLKDITSNTIVQAVRDFYIASEEREIRNVTAYLSRCIYNSIFNADLKLQADLKLNGLI